MNSTSAFPFPSLSTLAEVQAIVDSGLMETVHLEFKASNALNVPRIGEIAKDISAFANSDGGVIVYGIAEKDHKADHIDSGVDTKLHNREWLENVIQSNVSPRLDGLTIFEISIGVDRAVMVASVPRSERGPHQASYRYYKRFNFKCEPMEDYEVNDVRNRRVALPPLLSVRIDVVRGGLLEFCIENVGDVQAADLTFAITPTLFWMNGAPPAIQNGVKSLQPKKKLRFVYGVAHQAFAAESQIIREFSVEATYFHHGVHKRLTDRFDIDLNSLEQSVLERTDLEQHATQLEAALTNLATETKKVSDQLSQLKPLADPTGLALSYTTVRTLAKILGVEPPNEKLDPRKFSWQGLQEILSVDIQMASNLNYFFEGRLEGKKLAQLAGMTPELVTLIQERFRVDPTLLEP